MRKETHEVVLVTPKIARELLGANINARNRTLKKSHVNFLAKLMSDGCWVYNGDSIKIGADGILYDGQHRLAAVVLSGKAQHMLFVRGLGTEALMHIDIGEIQRSAADVLNIARGETAWVRRVPIVRMLNALLTDDKKLSTDSIEALYGEHTQGIDWACRLGRDGIGFTPIAAALAYAYAREPSRVAEFAERAQTGEGHTKNSPILIFRESVILGRGITAGQAIRRSLALKTLCAIQAFLINAPMTELKPSEDGLEFFKGHYAGSTKKTLQSVAEAR